MSRAVCIGAGPARRRLARALAIGAGLWLAARAATAAVGLTELPAPPETGAVTVFYLTDAAPTRVQRGPFTLTLAVDAAPKRGNRKLIVMSHGSGGAPWPQADLASALVDAGFTVAMPEHAGDNHRDMRDVGPVSWRHRPREVALAIDAVQRDPRFAGLDFQRVGMYGMSAGGLAALTLAGAHWSPARLSAHCQTHIADDFPTCVGLMSELTGGWLDGLRLAIARALIHLKFSGQTREERYRDSRIAAVVAAVPMAAPVNLATLAGDGVPLGLVRAGNDAWLAPRWHIDAVRAACRRCVLLADLADGGHGSILSPQVPGLPARAARLLSDPPGFDRAHVTRANAAITAFFLQNLAP